MIPLARPLLPPVTAISPYLDRIDANRYYTNAGPLALELEERLSNHFGCPLITASSATSAMTACLIALGLPHHSSVALPSFTFPATACAVTAAGHTPFFCDVNPHDWGIDTGIDSTSPVICVYPFGSPVTPPPRTVLIDAAAGFDTVKSPSVPTVISTHATKSFCTGEGGLVMSPDPGFLKEARKVLNFGIAPDRRVEYTGLNGKMSEYHAAVGLAELDGWRSKREKWIQIRKWYCEDFGWHPDQERALPTMIWRIEHIPASIFVSRMVDKGVEASLVRYGCHMHRPYARCHRADMTVTDRLLESLVMLPFFVDMTHDQVKRTVEAAISCV